MRKAPPNSVSRTVGGLHRVNRTNFYRRGGPEKTIPCRGPERTNAPALSAYNDTVFRKAWQARAPGQQVSLT